MAVQPPANPVPHGRTGTHAAIPPRTGESARTDQIRPASDISEGTPGNPLARAGGVAGDCGAVNMCEPI